jgi:hypothetical protein
MTRAQPTRTTKRERGQNLIEFALLMPVVIIFIAIIIIIGLAMNTRASLQQGVREGARQAAVGKTLTQVRDIAAGNAPENIDPADVAWCHPPGEGGSRGKVGDPVAVYLWIGGSEGYDYTLTSASGIFGWINVGDFSVNMSPVATARLERAFSGTPVNCPAGIP